MFLRESLAVSFSQLGVEWSGRYLLAPPDTHIKRQATRHDCLPRLLGCWDKWKMVFGEEQNIVYWADYSRTKRVQRTNQGRTPFICTYFFIPIWLSVNIQQWPTPHSSLSGLYQEGHNEISSFLGWPTSSPDISDRLERKRKNAGGSLYSCAHRAQLNFDNPTPYI